MSASAVAAEAWGRRARRRLGDASSVVPRLPGVLEAGRGVAYLAAREAALLACVSGPGPMAACLDALAPLLPGLAGSGARWTGAGALGGASTVSWFAFEGPHDSALLFTEGPEPEGSPLWASVLAPLGGAHPGTWRLSVGQQGRLPHDAYAVLEAARPVPVWELPGFAHLAPGARLRAPLDRSAVARAS